MQLLISNGPPINDLAYERGIIQTFEIESPLLFIYEWKTPVLVLGYGQSLTGIDTGFAVEKNIAVLRRISGGTGVLSTHSLSVSLFLANSEGPGSISISGLYDLFLECVAEAAGSCGILTQKSMVKEKTASPVCFFSQSGETLIKDGKKFFGGAQMRSKRVLMVHGTMLLDADLDLYSRIFNVGKEELAEKIISVSVSPREIKRKLATSFSKKLEEKIEGIYHAVSDEKMLDEQLGEKWSPLTAACSTKT